MPGNALFRGAAGMHLGVQKTAAESGGSIKKNTQATGLLWFKLDSVFKKSCAIETF
jgi:hypothetical protein